MPRYIRWFRDIRLRDLPLVGGKTASLGELYGELAAAGVRVPNGFAVTAEAYAALLDGAGVRARLESLVRGISGEDVTALARAGMAARALLLEAPWPAGLDQEIRDAYATMQGETGVEPAVAVRSSATAEDLPEASFAGQQETFLGVRGPERLLEACRRCFASLFTDRAIVYRVEHGFDHLAVRLSVAVQRMVRADTGAAGVMFTIDPDSGSPDVVVINAAYGLGEPIVKGELDPDEFRVFKPALRAGQQAILQRAVRQKIWKLGLDPEGAPVRLEVPAGARLRPSLSDPEVLELARLALAIEAHYSAKVGRAVPMDIEWARDGEDERLYILQARPETVHRAERRPQIEVFTLGPVDGFERLATGRAIGDRIGVGRARRLRDPRDLGRLEPGEVLVAPMTDPDWEPIMKRAAAIVTDRGGRTCHAAIVSRELGVPCIVGTERGTETIPEGATVTVSCAEGEDGAVFRGAVPFQRRIVDLGTLPRPITGVMLNVGNPGEAFRLGTLPADGVGLARIEFIIASVVKAHPLALLHPERVTDPATRSAIDALTDGYADRAGYFVDRLAEGVATIAAAFYPRDVIVRLSDFKSNEYAGLIGGREFEPAEANPMLGFRGASRYAHPRYREGFALECRAMRRVRDDMGLTNVKLMIPFCRTPEEGQRVVTLMAEHGLRRGERGLEVYVMCEIPSNVILAREFAQVFDGFSIGSNDLTQLVLGVDRDSELVAPIFDERNPAVLAMVGAVIEAARAAGRRIGICGQAPSDYPEFTRFLVERGITSISLNPDALLRGLEVIAAAEAQAGRTAPRGETPPGHAGAA
ncbi:MAG TPA: phosphoenolpyruvate synthase [Methylomirabilota bacterium]|nr:phosphoenolpyruvate synthase [Methylomirabilota bacterium]